MNFAFVFPGQGSQSMNMMAGLLTVPEVKHTFEEASEQLKIDLWEMMLTGPVDVLNTTINTQPLMLTAGVATWRAWLAQGGRAPNYVAGHSLGEYSALVAAEVMSFADTLALVQVRAHAMQEATSEGAMAAILGLTDEQVITACQSAAEQEVLQAVNFNAPGQVVIAGHKQAVMRGIEACKALGAKRAILLPVSVPAHSALMKPAAEKLRAQLNTMRLKRPTIPILHNADVQTHLTEEALKEVLIKQLFYPVRWVETIIHLTEQNIFVIAESGPGKVLTGLNKRIHNQTVNIALTDCASFEQLKQQIEGN